jgi:hypothetical protein
MEGTIYPAMLSQIFHLFRNKIFTFMTEDKFPGKDAVVLPSQQGMSDADPADPRS